MTRLLPAVIACVIAFKQPAAAQLLDSPSIKPETYRAVQNILQTYEAQAPVRDFLAANHALAEVIRQPFDRLTPQQAKALGVLEAHLPPLWPDMDGRESLHALPRILRAYTRAQSAAISAIDDRIIAVITPLLRQHRFLDAERKAAELEQLDAYSLYGTLVADHAHWRAAQLVAMQTYSRAVELARQLHLEVVPRSGMADAVVWAPPARGQSGFTHLRAYWMQRRNVRLEVPVPHEIANRIARLSGSTSHSDYPRDLHLLLQHYFHLYYYSDLTDAELARMERTRGTIDFAIFLARRNGLSAAQAKEFVALAQKDSDNANTLNYEEQARLYEFLYLMDAYSYSDLTFAEIRELAQWRAWNDMQNLELAYRAMHLPSGRYGVGILKLPRGIRLPIPPSRKERRYQRKLAHVNALEQAMMTYLPRLTYLSLRALGYPAQDAEALVRRDLAEADRVARDARAGPERFFRMKSPPASLFDANDAHP